ncbi:HAD-IA family hydrolase [Pseudooctadecabacter jejudonensis]|uniref:Phosphorylated carbohydrates phosphatase n=1 Tax=Pseudooctadecabacter jejudonensis TaxID=1391910 RepID=A0A1Y5SMF6_9RHOB|nr:HAD-IA family hydrolase [Pseudooctadecabacter jejudonensis]SLN43518.1 Phosphorylated carbohydrates phosphatase [Pseudooctadecabacter jejudonensis]
MTSSALIFGSIGSVAETSDLQRRAFNAAFADAGLEWEWSLPEYKEMLRKPGGRNRIADYAAARGDDVDAEALHEAKVEAFERMVKQEGLVPRPGVVEVITAARDAGMLLGWATTTTPRTVELMLSGLFPTIPRSIFEFIGDATMVEAGKPAPDIYTLALSEMGVRADEAVAVEDTPEAAEAAVAAQLRTIGFANEMAAGRSFPEGVTLITNLLDADVVVHKDAA